MDADEALRLIQDADQADLPVEDIACSSGEEVGDSDNDFISSDEEDRLNDDLFFDLEQIGSDSADDIAIPVPVAARWTRQRPSSTCTRAWKRARTWSCDRARTLSCDRVRTWSCKRARTRSCKRARTRTWYTVRKL